MDFFGMGAGEVLAILVVALIIWGPGKIPEIARTMGKVVRTFRKATFDLTTQITKELEIEEKERVAKAAAPELPKAEVTSAQPGATEVEK